MRGRVLDLPHRPWAAAGLLLLLTALGVANWSIDASSPEPAPADAPEDAFSADRAWETVEAMAVEPHPMGTPEKDRVRDLLAAELSSLGFDVEVQTELATDAGDGDGLVRFGVVDNIVATLPGTDPTGAVLLTSHYDSVPSGPGAADAASGVAAIVETARALSLEGPQRNDLVVLLTDGEEMGLFGAEAYARSHPAGDTPTVVFNLEARGVSGPSLMFETSADNAALIDLFADAAPHPHGDSSAIEAYRQLPNDTDFTRFHEAGYIGLNNAFIGGASWYHSPYDDTEHLDPASLQHHGENTLGTARELVGMDLASLESDRDQTFFGFFGLLVHYDEGWNLPVALIGFAAAIAAAVIARVRRLLSLPRLALAFASFAVPAALAGAAAVGLWPALQAVRPGYADTYGLLFDRTWYYLAILVFGLALVAAWYVALRRRLGEAALALAPLLWLALLGQITAFAVPGLSFVFAVPALAAVGLLAAMLLEPRSRPFRLLGYALFAIALVPAVVQSSWTANLIEAFGMELAAVPAVLIVLFAAPALPILTMWRRYNGPAGRLVPAAAALAALALVGTGLAVDRFSAEHPRQAFLSYVLDADTGAAAWVSTDHDRSEWTAGYVTDDGLEDSGLPAAYVDAAPATGFGPAAPLALEPPAAVYESRTAESATLHVSSPRGANTMWLAVYGDPERAEAALADGTAVDVQVSPPAEPGDPSLIWFFDVPEEGFALTLHGDADSFAVTVFDQTHGIEGIDGYADRPDGLMRSRDRLSDTVTVAAAAR
ncbi:M28 family peptidase [Glycomyces harbinensis]|uniref:Zn-dependent amino-or carboxypeptidase, M28 family n=1 Tax=Glycomyces harbinensis TaxID=58114 RepID=A0A1G7AEP8_9ACTN|nr:M28 family peptidase [Glycomyces harbinensis]SDE13163.1 Zn-dependent amino-or carboxypeptidase, M28 family [Glycomyces harbinensis]